MFEFHATSSRIEAGHGTNLFTRNKALAIEWAEREAKNGHYAEVMQVSETVIATFEPVVKEVTE